MNWKKLGSFLTIGLLFTACDNTIDINAPWVETPVVYALIDINQPVQYMRIQKTYQNAADVPTSAGAQITDSLYFDTIIATLLNTSNRFATPDTLIKIDTTMQDGYFSNAKHYLYKSTKAIDPNGVYKLNIYSPKTGKEYNSTTNIISKAEVVGTQTPVYLYIEDDRYFNVRFKTGSQASMYDVLVRFIYREYPVGNPGAYVIKWVDWTIETNSLVRTQGETKTYLRKTSEYLNFLKKSFPVNAAVERKIEGLQYVIMGGSEAMRTMAEVNKPSNSIVPKNSVYSNIQGGIGIFSSRNVLTQNMTIAEQTKPAIVSVLPNFVQ